MSRKTAGSEKKSRGTAKEGLEPTAAQGAHIDQLGELPRTYGANAIFLVAQEPHWLFTYWDIDIARHPGGASFLRVFVGDDASAIETEIEVPFETRNWYIPVNSAGAAYTVEIGYYRAKAWNVIARSATIHTPPDNLSGSHDFDYATIPLHLSFQKLIESVQAGIRSGESLAGAVARLQKDGGLGAVGPGIFPDLAGAQRMVIEALLGRPAIDELTSGSFSSEEIASRVRTLIEERLSSGNASELPASGQWGAGESSLFSALSAIAGGAPSSWGPAGETSSWTPAGISSWATAALSSWSPAEISSWAAAALTSWSAAEQAQSSWNSGPLASWFQAAQTSWSQAVLSSWSQAALTSWTQGAITSWSGASENVSSFSQARNFFMHVNAEVIFYGGTDPRAKVTVDGKPITLNPDGSFRYHFVFPDGTYEIPIVATSPDGLETRSAILRFERDTRRTGQVDHTPQPPLGAPMGAGS